MKSHFPLFAGSVSLDAVRFSPSGEAKLLPQHSRTNTLKLFALISVLIFASVLFPWKHSEEQALSQDNIIKIINQDRGRFGLLPLKPNPRLSEAALKKAQDMLEHGYFAHTSPAGTKPWDFIKEANLDYHFAGENLARGYQSPYELEQDFLSSPTHRENLLSPLFSDVGIAVVKGSFQGKTGTVIVQMFAQPVDRVAVSR